MSDLPPDIVVRLAKLAAIDIPDAHVDGVAMWLDVLATHAALIDEIPIADDIEIAPVFRA